MSRRTLLLAFLPFALLLGTGLVGIDFGEHWDEDRRHLQVLADAVEAESLLPSFYNYPSMAFDLNRLALVPESLGAGEGATAKERMLAAIDTHGFRLRLRSLFLLVSSLATLWVFVASRAAGRSRWEAAFASFALATSFEVAYHVRWIAPDGLLMSFGALTLGACLLACRAERGIGWLVAAAVAAGLGCGSKYPGGLLLVPVAITALYVARRDASGRAFWLRSAALVAGATVLFVLTFLAVTPGAIFEHDLFREHVEWEKKHYSVDGHPPYTVEKGLPHASRMAVYLVTQVPSPFTPLAVLLFALALVGAVAWTRESPKTALVALAFPLLYVAYMASVRVMIVRNLLVLAPFLALFAGRGATALMACVARERARVALASALGLVLLVDTLFLVRTAHAIHTTDAERGVRAFANDLERADQAWLLSSGVRAELDRLGLESEGGSDSAETMAVFRDELTQWYRVEMRWPFDPFAIQWYGTRDVNYVYYPTWTANRILVLPVETLRGIGFPVQELVKR